MQKILAQRPQEVRTDNADVRLNHYRVLLELLNLRCRLLEQWLEEEATLVATQEERHSEALKRMEQQVQNLAGEVQEQVATMTRQQETLEMQHCHDYSVWSDELVRGREEAAREIAALQEDLKHQEERWHEEWKKMQQSALVQGIEVADPPGFLLHWCTAQQEDAASCESDSRPSLSSGDSWIDCMDGGRPATPLETIHEVATEEAEFEVESTSSRVEEVKRASDEFEVPAHSPRTCSSSSRSQDSRFESRTGPSPSSRSSVRTPLSMPLCTDVPEELMRSLDKACDNQQTSRAWARIGQFHQRQKSFEKARCAYHNAVKLDNQQHGCLANLAQLEAHAGNVDMAKEMLTAALRLDPGNKNYLSFNRWLAGTAQ